MTPNLYRVAIVGAGGLKGRELAEVLNERRFPAADIKLLDDNESLGQIEAVGEEATFIQRVQAENFRKVDFTFFASDSGFTRQHWKMAKNAGSAVIDLSYALEGEPRVAIRAPWVERELGSTPVADLETTAVVAAHPAAVTLAILLLRAQKAVPIRRAIANIFEPVSERGKRGMDELHEQTINLLSFQQLPKSVFDLQIAFNMVPHYGERASISLSSVQSRIAQHFGKITAGKLPMPALMLVQSPIFHAHIFAIYIETEKEIAPQKFELAFAGEHVAITPAGEEAPNNVNTAGEENILLTVRPDDSQRNGFWLWAAVDNLKLSAITAVDCAAALALTRSKGSVQ